MGSVYLARDTQLNRRVALKIPKVAAAGSKRLSARLETEARAAAQLDHPCLCKVYDAGEIDGKCYIAMQYVAGQTLKSQLDELRKTPEEATSLILQLAEGLAEAHELGIVHRDLKPENIMINRKGIPVIMDFGLARLSTVTRSAAATQAGTILGSPAYMSPEQAIGDVKQIDQRSDIYSLGVIFFELLTGQWPFQGAAMQILGQKSLLDPPSPASIKPELPPQLSAICWKMIAKSQAARYQTLTDVITDLNEVRRSFPHDSSAVDSATANRPDTPSSSRNASDPDVASLDLGSAQVHTHAQRSSAGEFSVIIVSGWELRDRMISAWTRQDAKTKWIVTVSLAVVLMLAFSWIVFAPRSQNVNQSGLAEIQDEQGVDRRQPAKKFLDGPVELPAQGQSQSTSDLSVGAVFEGTWIGYEGSKNTGASQLTITITKSQNGHIEATWNLPDISRNWIFHGEISRKSDSKTLLVGKLVALDTGAAHGIIGNNRITAEIDATGLNGKFVWTGTDMSGEFESTRKKLVSHPQSKEIFPVGAIYKGNWQNYGVGESTVSATSNVTVTVTKRVNESFTCEWHLATWNAIWIVEGSVIDRTNRPDALEGVFVDVLGRSHPNEGRNHFTGDFTSNLKKLAGTIYHDAGSKSTFQLELYDPKSTDTVLDSLETNCELSGTLTENIPDLEPITVDTTAKIIDRDENGLTIRIEATHIKDDDNFIWEYHIKKDGNNYQVAKAILVKKTKSFTHETGEQTIDSSEVTFSEDTMEISIERPIRRGIMSQKYELTLD